MILTDGTFNNNGTIVLGKAGTLSGSISGVGTFNNAGTMSMFFNSTAAVYSNSGTITLSPGVFSTLSLAPIMNSGTLLIQNGTLSLNSGPTGSITYTNGAYVGGTRNGQLRRQPVCDRHPHACGIEESICLRLDYQQRRDHGYRLAQLAGRNVAGNRHHNDSPGATLSVANTNSATLSSTLSNQGVVNFASGNPYATNGTLSNESTGVININSSFSITHARRQFATVARSTSTPAPLAASRCPDVSRMPAPSTCSLGRLLSPRTLSAISPPSSQALISPARARSISASSLNR